MAPTALSTRCGKSDGRYRIKGALFVLRQVRHHHRHQGGCLRLATSGGDALPAPQSPPNVGNRSSIAFRLRSFGPWLVALSTLVTCASARPTSCSTSADLHRANSDDISFKAEVYAAVHEDLLACSKLIASRRPSSSTSTSWAYAAYALTWDTTPQARLPSSTSLPPRLMARVGARCTSKICSGSWARR